MFPQVSDFRPVAHLWLLYNFFTTYPWHPPTKGSNVVLSLGNNCLHNILFVLWQSQKQLPCPPCNPSISDQIITFHWTICPRQLHMSGGWAAFVQFHRFALLETRQCQILWERRCFRFCFCSIIKKTLPQSGNPTHAIQKTFLPVRAFWNRAKKQYLPHATRYLRIVILFRISIYSPCVNFRKQIQNNIKIKINHLILKVGQCAIEKS